MTERLTDETFATRWDGDASLCVMCADVVAAFAHRGEPWCADCYIRHLEGVVSASAAPADDPRIEGYEQAYQYALTLADNLRQKHYPENTEWRPLGELVSLLTQIDNMVSGFVRGGLLETDDAAPADDLRAAVPNTLTAAQLADACMSYRHDYGLMDIEARETMRREAAEWWRCFEKTLNNPPAHLRAALSKGGE